MCVFGEDACIIQCTAWKWVGLFTFSTYLDIQTKPLYLKVWDASSGVWLRGDLRSSNIQVWDPSLSVGLTSDGKDLPRRLLTKTHLPMIQKLTAHHSESQCFACTYKIHESTKIQDVHNKVFVHLFCLKNGEYVYIDTSYFVWFFSFFCFYIYKIHIYTLLATSQCQICCPTMSSTPRRPDQVRQELLPKSFWTSFVSNTLDKLLQNTRSNTDKDSQYIC